MVTEKLTYLCSKTILTVTYPDVTPKFSVEVDILSRASVNKFFIATQEMGWDTKLESFIYYK